VTQDYFSNNNQSKECKSAVDYINTVKDCKPYILNSLYATIMKRIADKNEGVAEYIASIVEDGGKITGASSLGEEDKDILFLAGYLAQLKHIKKIIVLTHHDIQFNKDIADGKHSDVLAKLAEQVGVDLAIEIGIISPQSFNSIRDAI
jgi:hypothetical protein